MKTKQCFKCEQEKTLDCFYKHPDMPDGTVNKCKDCNKVDVKNNYKKNIQHYKNYEKNRYRYNEERLMLHKYLNLKARCEGKSSHKCSTEGKRYLTHLSFKKWWKVNREKYLQLYKVWEKNGFPNKLAPSIDRVDNKRGYMPSNMQWLSHTDNCKKHTK